MIAGQFDHAETSKPIWLGRYGERFCVAKANNLTAGRMRRPSVGCHGRAVCFFKWTNAPGELNKSLEKRVVFILALQPQMLEDIMSFVVFLGIEADEICQIAWIEIFRVEPERLYISLNALCLLIGCVAILQQD